MRRLLIAALIAAVPVLTGCGVDGEPIPPEPKTVVAG